MLVCAFFCAYCTRDRGCSAHPVFPAPSDFKGRRFSENLGRICRENAKSCLQLEYCHCEEHLRRSNPLFLRDPAARNDGLPPPNYSAAFAVLPNIRVGVAKPHEVPSVTLT